MHTIRWQMTREPDRPDPDALLAKIKAQELPATGTLRIYLGAAPGVGKTYTMLQEAHRRKERGTDVVVGFVETHGRPHTAEQLGDLEIVPPREVPYKGVVVREMDTERDPGTAPPGRVGRRAGAHQPARLPPREALRGRGGSARRRDHVISTLNVQHIESLNDIVKGITGVSVRETYPTG